MICSNCTQLVLLRRENDFLRSWMASHARNLAQFVEEQFMCLPRAKGAMSTLGLVVKRTFQESTAVPCEDPILGKGSTLFMFLCPTCSKRLDLPSKEDFLLELNEQADKNLKALDRIIEDTEPEDEKLIKATLDIMEDER